ncbi:MAG: Na/Pi cotransporter family protein [Spirochaetes bacterium]|nr:Na/Pi cotransporter family protein [Spirochaetota bacterium]
MDTLNAILMLIIGAGVFLTGIVMFSESVKKNTSKKARALFDKISNNSFKGYGVGVAVTAIIQSSTATNVMSVGLVSAGMLTLFQAAGIVLGAHVGTTSTLYLVALSTFNIRYVLMAMVFAGALIKIISKDTKMINIADFLIGFGIMFVGLHLMGRALRGDPVIQSFFENLFYRMSFPLLLMFFGCLFTIVIQSSTASMAVYYSMMDAELLGFEGAVFLALGSYVGTTFTALFASITANREGKRIAVVNLFFATWGALLLASFLWPLRGVILPLFTENIPLVWQLPVFQTCANFIMTILTFGMIKPFCRLTCYLIKSDEEIKKPFGPTHLNDQLIEENINIALDAAKNEIIAGAELVQDMFGKVDLAFKKKDLKLINEICETDSKVDILYRAVIPYLAKVSGKELGDEESKRSMNYLYIKNELESIGDVVEKSIMPLAKIMTERDLSFSEHGSIELSELFGKVNDNIHRMLIALKEENALLAKKIIDVYAEVDERKYQRSHIDRLQQGHQASLDTSSIHFDLINFYTRINEYIVFIAKRILWLTRDQV